MSYGHAEKIARSAAGDIAAAADAHPINSRLYDDPDTRRILAVRDVGAIFRSIKATGVSYRRIAALVGMSQSEVSEIISGRQVQGYDVLVRIAEGLRIPRERMGLAYADGPHAAYDEGCPSAPLDEEVDEAVQRRRFLNAVMGAVVSAAWGSSVPEHLLEPFEPLRDAPMTPLPSQLGMADVSVFEQTTTRLGLLDREAGGMAAREALVAMAATGERLLNARCTDVVRQRMRYAVADAHRIAGWASGDVGLTDHCRCHMHQALDHAQGSPDRVAEVLAAAGDMEKHHGAPDDALKLFQLAAVGTARSSDPQIGAVLHGLSASAYLTLGHPDRARAELSESRAMFADADGGAGSLPFFAFYGPGHGLLAATGTKLADYETARTDVRQALNNRPDYDVRCNALDTIVLATILINAGELREGIGETRRALGLVTEVGSHRVRDRLEPLERALLARRDSTCHDLAHRVATARNSALQLA